MLNRSQQFTSSDTFTVPAGVSLVFVTLLGSGGAGTTNEADNGGNVPAPGGGSGGLYVNMPWSVTPGQVILVTIGAAGTSRSRFVFLGSNGSACTFGNLSVDGGKSGWWQDNGHPYGGGGGRVSPTLINYPSPYGQGGGAWAPADSGPGDPGATSRLPGSPVMFPGSTGAAFKGTGTPGTNGGAAPGYAGGVGFGGSGGGATPFGGGGDGGLNTAMSQTNGSPGSGYGSGGGGAGCPFKSGGVGATGYCLIAWTAPA